MKRSLAGVLVTGAFAAICLIGMRSALMAQSPSPPESATSTSSAKTTAAESKEIKEIDDAVVKFKNRDYEGALKLLQEAVKKHPELPAAQVIMANFYFKDRDFDNALKALQEVVKANPDLPPAQVIMADFFAQANAAAGARNYWERAVMSNPDDPEAYVIMGDVAVNERRVTEADMLYQKALALMSKSDMSAKRKDRLWPRILGGLASVDEAREKWANAQKQLEAWLKREPESAVAMQRLAHVMFQQKDATGAYDMLKKAAKVDPKMLSAEAVLARLYGQTGDRKNAKIWMDEALRLKPKDLATRLVAGNWYLQTEDLAAAKAQADAALKIDPTSLDGQLLMGVVALFEKDYKTAENYFSMVVMKVPSRFEGSNNLALALIEQKDPVKQDLALQYATDNVKKYPKSAEAVSTYGWVLYKLKKPAEAMKAFEAVIGTGQFSPDTAYYYARLCADQKTEQATKIAKVLLDSALKGTAPFSMRPEAKVLQKELNK